MITRDTGLEEPLLVLLVLLVLAAAAWVWLPAAGELHVAGDDRFMMSASRDVNHGQWIVLLEPQNIHAVPLFRLIRLYFDLHFPARFRELHWLVMGAHLAGTALLFALSAFFFRWRPAALTAAFLFGSTTLGAEAIIIKSQATFVFGLVFLLGALFLLLRQRATAAFFCLVAAVGVHSLGAVLAIPGILVAYYLLAQGRRPLGAWLACSGAFLIGAAVWTRVCLPALRTGRNELFHGGPPTLREILARLWDGVYGGLLHFGFLIRHAEPSIPVLAGAAVALVVVLAMLRNEPGSHWLLAAMAFTVLPICAILVLRGSPGYQSSRYCYQSFVLLAVAGGALVEAVLTILPPRAMLRSSFLFVLVIAAGLYLANQRSLLVRNIEILHFSPTVTKEFWFGWDDFFKRAATRARATSTEFRLPSGEFGAGLTLVEAFVICNPRGRAGITALSPEQTQPTDCANFQRALRELHAPVAPALSLQCRTAAAE